MGIHPKLAVGASALALAISAPASAVLFGFNHASGLSAEAELTLVDSTHLEIRLRNTSTGAPGGFTASQQLLSGVSFDIGYSGAHFADQEIVSGSVNIGAGSQSVNFDSGEYGEGFDVTGEFGYSNSGDSSFGSHHQNMLAATSFGGNFLRFNGENLNGPLDLNGASASLLSMVEPIAIGDLSAIRSEIIATMTLSFAVGSMDDIIGNGVMVSFGDPALEDVLYVEGLALPAPAALPLLALAGLAVSARRRRP